MQNNLQDLANHLFEQVERLLDDEVCADAETTKREIEKTNAMCNCASQITEIGKLQLTALRLSDTGIGKMPDLIESKK